MLRRYFRRRPKGVTMVEYAVLIGAVTLIGVLAVSEVGHRAADLIKTTAVLLPGAQTTDDHKMVHSHFIETGEGNDDTVVFDEGHLGGGDTNRLNHNTGFGDSNVDSVFVIQDVD